MEDLKQAKKTFSGLGWCYIAGTVAVYLLQLLVVKFVFAARPEWQSSVNINLIISCITTYGCGMPLIVFLARKIPANPPERRSMKWWQFLLGVMICYSLVYLSNLIGTGVAFLIGLLKGSPVQNEVLEIVSASSLGVNFLTMVVLAPIIEEYVFRKVIVDKTRQFGEGMAVATSAVMFGLFHGNLNQFAYAVVLGAFFSFIYLKTGKLKITIGMHMFVNFLGGIVAPALLFMLDLDELLELQEMNPSDTSIIMEYFFSHLGAWILFFLYFIMLFAIVIVGAVLFFVNIKKFKLENGPDDVPKGKRFGTLFVNPGMLTFVVIWLALIVLQLLM